MIRIGTHKNYLILFLLLFFSAIPLSGISQNIAQIGNGTTFPSSTLYSPLYRFSASSTTSDSKSNILFTASEMSAAGIASGDLITAIAFNKGTDGTFLIPVQYTIRMGNTSAIPPLTGTIASEWTTILANHTTVFSSSSFNIPATSGWVTITLNTPFLYTGGSLEISTELDMTGGSSGATDKLTWEYTAGFADNIIGEAGTNSNVVGYKQRPNIRITHVAGVPCSGTPTAGTATATTRVCASEPVDLMLSGATNASGITYQWQSAPVGTTNFTDISGATSMAYMITNQTADTDYRCIVTCTHSNSSDISNVVNVPQPNLLGNFSENFDTTATGTTSAPSVPTCWSYIDDIASTGYGYTISSTPQSSPNTFRLYRTNSTSNSSQDLVLVSPQTDNLGNGTKQLRFSVRSYSTTTYINKLEIISMPDNTTTVGATVLATVYNDNTNGQLWNEYIVPIPATTDDYFGFRLAYNETTTASSVLIDDVFYEDLSACAAPNDFNVANITSNSVDLSWSPSIDPSVSQYYYEIRQGTIVVASGTVNGTSVVVSTGLLPGNEYIAYIRSVCAGTNGGWSTFPLEFQTLCAVINSNFSENFDTTSTGTTSNATYPLCWSYIDEITTTGYGYVEGGGSSQSTPNSFRLYRTNSTTNTSQNLVLISPETDNLGNGTKQLRFSAMALNTNESNLLQIVRSNGATSSSTFTVVQEIVINHTGHQEYIVPLPVTTDDFFGFRLAHNGTTIAVDINIDDVFYEDLSPCIFPMNLGISGITTTGGTISWDASGAAGVTGYEWEVRDINDNVIRSGSTNGVNATTATVSMLTPATDYFLYVRSRCGTSTGIWTSFPVSFQTLCAVLTSIEENFDDTPTGTTSVESYPRCWSYLDEIVTSGYGYVEAATAKSSPNSFRLYRTNSTANSSQNLVLISPETNNLGAGTKRIRFSAMAANTNASNKLQVVRSTGTTSSATYTVLEEIIVDHTNYVEYAVAIPNTTDDYFGFRLAHNGTTSVTDINIDDVYYEDIPPLTVSTSKVDILCFGNGDGSAEAIGEGGVPPYTYSWTPSGATTETINNLSGGQYTVTVTDAWNKTATATVTITEPTQLVSNLVHTPVSCNGQNNGSATVAPSGGVAPYTVLWSDNTIGNTKNNLSPGTYSVTIRDANHCVLTETFTITEPTVLTSVVSSQTNVSAYGGNDGSATITVTGGTAPYTYAWSPSGGTGDSASNLTAGTYTVLITDARGCTTTQTVVITQPAPPYEIVLVSKEDISCNGANDGSITVNVTGGTAPYTYLWSTPLGGNSPSVSNLSPGAYTLTVTDSDNSTLTETFTIIEPAVLTANTTKVDIGCSGQSNGTATVTAAGGTAPYTYLWSNGMTTATATNLQAGSYSVTVTDAKGCTVNASVSITQGSLMTVVGTKTDISCYGANDGSIVLNVTGGSSPYTYSWSNAATSQSIANLIKGTYTVTVTDANNCSETVSFTIVEPTFVHPPVATNQIFCLGQTSQLSDVVITGSNIKWYSSSTGGTLLPATTVLTNGTTYYASQTVGACESARIGVQITLGQGTPLTTTQLNVCSNTRVQNMTVDGFNYTQLKWFDTASSPTPLVASQLLSSKTYYVSSVVGNCESPRQAIQVTVAAAVSVPSASSQTVCGNTTLNDLVVNKDPGATLRWYNSLQSMNPLAGTTVVSSGTYYVQQVVGGCESTRVAVSVQVINVSAPAMTSIATCAGVTVGDFNTASTTYVWYTDATTTTALPTSYVLTTGNYYIAEEVSGCISARANVSVVVNARPASPTGALKQVFNFAATVADLQMVEPNVSWFASYQDALMQVNQLPSNTRLQTGTTYYGILTGTSNCGSLPTAVDVTIDLLGLAELDLAQLKYYPNPVESELNIDYIDEITKVEVFTITGQKVLSKMYNHSEVKVDVSTLSSGTYMVRIETANASQFIKIVKK